MCFRILIGTYLVKHCHSTGLTILHISLVMYLAVLSHLILSPFCPISVSKSCILYNSCLPCNTHTNVLKWSKFPPTLPNKQFLVLQMFEIECLAKVKTMRTETICNRMFLKNFMYTVD